MGDKKKQEPIPAPKAPPAPAKQQAPPTTDTPDTVPVPENKPDDAAGAPARDLSDVPVEAKDKPEHMASPDVPDLAITKSAVTVPFDPIKWGPIMQEFRLRAVPLTGREYDSVEQYWHCSYKSLIHLGATPDLAIDITNAAMPTAVSLSLSRDYPTTEERFDRDTERMLGPGKSLGKVMIPLTPGIEWGVGKIIGKKFKLEF